jgi:hypothetical protein
MEGSRFNALSREGFEIETLTLQELWFELGYISEGPVGFFNISIICIRRIRNHARGISPL